MFLLLSKLQSICIRYVCRKYIHNLLDVSSLSIAIGLKLGFACIFNNEKWWCSWVECVERNERILEKNNTFGFLEHFIAQGKQKGLLLKNKKIIYFTRDSQQVKKN